MTLQERRHDRLAVRLSLIISRLVSGETLFIRKLATEFGVSERTLRRDFRERLMYLDTITTGAVQSALRYSQYAAGNRYSDLCSPHGVGRSFPGL